MAHTRCRIADLERADRLAGAVEERRRACGVLAPLVTHVERRGGSGA